MKKLLKITPACKPKTKESQQVALLYAFLLTVLVLCQLFTFDKFLTLLGTFGLPGGAVMARFVGSLVVISEVFALPFLLELNLNKLMRVSSMVFSWLAPLIWLKLALWLIFTNNTVSNIGLFGTIADLVPGWWAVYVSVALGIAAGWASWGLWPGKRK